MKSFSPAEVARVLKIKPHTLRYWTQSLPFVSPTKDAGGRLQYSMRDVVILQRVYYYFFQRNLPLSACREKIVAELSDDESLGKIQEIHALKADFVSLLRQV